MLLHHPNGTFSHFGGKTVGFIAFHGSIFSELGASSFPGAVHRASYELIDLELTRTFSGSSKPDKHRVVWQASLPPESAKIISEIIAAAITGEPS
jgi:hypothetical protein